MRAREKRAEALPAGLGILAFVLAFAGGAASKFVIKPSWAEKYAVQWSDELGTRKMDIPYGGGEANKFDLYLPADNTKGHYGLVVYLHAGGFTSGDKSDDTEMLSWLCSKGYAACGINYTLRTDINDASVLSQSNEIKAAIPKVIEAAEAEGYTIDKLAMAGGSAGHTLAMLYAYRDAAEAPVPVALTFGAVGPSCFHTEDWDNYGFDRNTPESDLAASGLFGVMAGVEISVDEIKSGAYLEKMKPISAADWITPDSAPTVAAYGMHDRVQPFKASLRLRAALEENGVDYQYFECTHSGHGLQNDNAVYRQWMETVEVVLFVNGTGVAASRYEPVFEHLASWGFIAVGNEDPSTWEGKKADATLAWLLAANEDETSIFYHRVDTDNIGITGHSQGGVGVFNAINETEHKGLYKCAVSLSPTQEDIAAALKMPYDPAKTTIPVMLLAGAPDDVISLEGLDDMVKKISADVVSARRSNTDHGKMLYSGDGYVTAWFMWQLRGDEAAAAAFLGESAEILHNSNWQDVMIRFSNR